MLHTHPIVKDLMRHLLQIFSCNQLYKEKCFVSRLYFIIWDQDWAVFQALLANDPCGSDIDCTLASVRRCWTFSSWYSSIRTLSLVSAWELKWKVTMMPHLHQWPGRRDCKTAGSVWVEAFRPCMRYGTLDPSLEFFSRTRCGYRYLPEIWAFSMRDEGVRKCLLLYLCLFAGLNNHLVISALGSD